MKSICEANVAKSVCIKKTGHVERGDEEHACGAPGGGPSGLPCQGRWKGDPYTPEFTVTALPYPPPPETYAHYGVTTLPELLEIASEELRAPQPRNLSVRRGGIQFPTPTQETDS